jgi:hypothetical protein
MVVFIAGRFSEYSGLTEVKDKTAKTMAEMSQDDLPPLILGVLVSVPKWKNDLFCMARLFESDETFIRCFL